jgi:methionine-rich copper-binding protein CopC
MTHLPLNSKSSRKGALERHALFLAGALSLFLSNPAAAEPKLTFAAPVPGTTLGFFPGNFLLSFSEPVDLAQTRVTITGPDNTLVGLERLSASGNDVAARLTGTMGDGYLTLGVYKLAWRTVSRTGEAANGGYQFTVKDCGEITCP